MTEETVIKPHVYRAPTDLRTFLCILGSFFIIIGIANGIRLANGIIHESWIIPLLMIGTAVMLPLLALLPRFEIHPDKIRQRNCFGRSQRLLFAEISHAYLKRADDTSCLFQFECRDGRQVTTGFGGSSNPDFFPMQAAAALLAALETYGIQIEIPNHEARLYADKIRAKSNSREGFPLKSIFVALFLCAFFLFAISLREH